MTYLHDPELGRTVARFVGGDLREIGDHAAGEVVIEAEAVLGAHVLDGHAHVRAGALLTMCDNVGGLCGGLASLPDGWVVSTNLMVRATTLAVARGVLRFRSEVVRRGRNAVVTSVEVRDGEDAPLARGMLTSAVLVPRNGVPQWERPARIENVPTAPDELPAFYEWLGVRDDGDGVVLDVFDALRNPWGIVHGGVTAAVIDAAGVAVVPGAATHDAVVHYLAPNRVGPVRARGRALGARADGRVVRVEVRDEGADNRLTALAVITLR